MRIAIKLAIILALFISCGNKDKAKSSAEEGENVTTEEVNQLELESKQLDESVKEIEEKSKNLDKALKELDDI